MQERPSMWAPASITTWIACRLRDRVELLFNDNCLGQRVQNNTSQPPPLVRFPTWRVPRQDLTIAVEECSRSTYVQQSPSEGRTTAARCPSMIAGITSPVIPYLHTCIEPEVPPALGQFGQAYWHQVCIA